MLESKYEKYGGPSESENELISQLLSDHDQMVSLFKNTMRTLRDTDELAHQQLLKYLTHLNDQV